MSAHAAWLRDSLVERGEDPSDAMAALWRPPEEWELEREVNLRGLFGWLPEDSWGPSRYAPAPAVYVSHETLNALRRSMTGEWRTEYVTERVANGHRVVERPVGFRVTPDRTTAETIGMRYRRRVKRAPPPGTKPSRVPVALQKKRLDGRR